MLKKLTVLSVVIVLVGALALSAAAEYDKAAVVAVMRAAGPAMQEINKALDAGDFFTAATTLMDIAVGIKSLDAQTPRKGTKEEWDRIHADLVNAAFKGIGACGEGDVDNAKQYVSEVGALITEGHKMFR